jgi:Family of unknown function (DUF5321)
MQSLKRVRLQQLRSTFHHIQNHATISSPVHLRSQHTSHPATEASQFSLVPRVLRRSTWALIIPKFLRQNPLKPSSPKKKTRNPATYFIWIYLLIGSQAIRIIGVQSEFAAFTRKTDLRLQKLREVLRKLQAGEEVDVEKTLGTGNETEEKEWEEAMREIEEEEEKWVRSRKKMRERQDATKKEQVEEAEKSRREEERRLDASPVARQPENKIVTGAGFY